MASPCYWEGVIVTRGRVRIAIPMAMGCLLMALGSPVGAQSLGPLVSGEVAPPGGEARAPSGPIEALPGLAEPAQDFAVQPATTSAGDVVAVSVNADSGLAAVRRAWLHGAGDRDERIGRARRAALEQGVWNLDSGTRALIGSDWAGGNLEDIQAAVRLAPDLPASRMALAREIWLEDNAPIEAVRAASEALLAIPHHLRSSLWFSGNALYVLAISLIAGGLLALLVYACSAFPHAAHDLGDLLSSAMPNYARAGLLGAVLLVPVALGQGILGLALAIFALGILYGTTRQNCVLLLAAIAALLGAFPVAQLAGSVLSSSAGLPVIEAAINATEGFAMPVERRRLAAVAEEDPMAAAALAAATRRMGRLSDASAAYQQLLEVNPTSVAATNNAANVTLGLGQLESALELYRQGAELQESTVLLFNLSQGYGQAFMVDDLNRTLAAAQRLDGDIVAELTQLQGSDSKRFTVDLPLERKALWHRILRSGAGAAFSAELRSVVAPGWLGRGWRIAAGAFFLVALASLVGGARIRASHRCSRCGRRLCPRCDPEFGGEKICEGCTRLHDQPETTDRALRVARIKVLRERDHRLARLVMIASILIPGTAGLLARRHWAVLVGTVSASLAVAALFWRHGVVPDPLIAGSAAPVAFGLVTALAAIAYAIAVTASLAVQRRS